MSSFPPWNCRNGLCRAWPHLNMDSGSERPCFSKYFLDRSHLFLLCPVWGNVGLNGPGTHESARLELSTTQRQGRVGNIVLSGKVGGETIWKMASVCCNLLCFFLEKKLSSTERVFLPGPLLYLKRNSLYHLFLWCHEEATSKFILPWRVFKLSSLQVRQRQRK